MSRIAIQELSAVFVEKFNLPKSEAQRFVTTFFTLIQEGLESDGQVKVNGFGTFKIVNVDDRESVNVNTGERVVIEGHQKISFQPDSLMREMVNKPFSGFETVVINDGVVFEEISDTPADVDDGDEEEQEEEYMDEVDEPDAAIEEERTEASEAPLLDFGEETADPETPAEAEDTAGSEIPADPEETAEPEIPADSEARMEPEADEATVADGAAEANEDSEEAADEPSTHEMSRLQVMPEEPEYTEERSRWPLWAAAIVACLVSFGLGYWLGQQKVPLKVEEAIVAENTEAKSDNDSIAKVAVDSKAEDATPKAANHDTTAEEAPKTAKVEEKKPEEAPGLDKYEAMDSRIRTGAYRIVGTDTTIKVKPGMTIKKIARVLIGEELACYIAAYNGMKENDTLTVGQEIKIPKLEWKKKSKAKDNKQ